MHRDGAKQGIQTHHCVLGVSSPSMGLSIGVGLGAWETASAQRAPIPVLWPTGHRTAFVTGL